MCGIAGIISINKQPLDVPLLMAMTDKVRHRGPDDEGYLFFEEAQNQLSSYCGPDSPSLIKKQLPALSTILPKNLNMVMGMGFRRLSILELKPVGHQPMLDKELQIALSFNGEIYNHIELREQLITLGYKFFSHSDSEVIIKAYHAWGEGCVSHFNGMWAFALWDSRQHRLFCSRDRYGIKPFYYSIAGGYLYWGSEIKQLLLAPIDKSYNQAMIWRSLKINSLLIYDDETYWKSIHALKPGHNLIVTGDSVEISQYYALDTDNIGTSTLSYQKAVDEYRSIFLDAIALQLRSDVPVGASLSGGMDSSAIVCSAVRHLAEPIDTFSSFYADAPALDERKWVEIVAKHTGSRSHLVSPTANDAMDWWGKATYLNDLPIAAGFVSQYAVMQSAHSNGVKVLLSGQGSDELTAGYRHASYRYFADLIRQMQFGKLKSELPAYLRKNHAAAASIGKILLSTLLPESALYKLEFSFYRFEPFNDSFTKQAQKQAGEHILANITDLKASRLANFLYNMMHNTSIQTLLHFEDRLSMGHSVESRVPFLDHRLVDFVFSLPSQYKIKPPWTKLIHRQAMKDLIPPKIYHRKDKGIFSSPFYEVWMKGEMRGFLQDILASASFRQRGIWNLPKISHQWQRYLSGEMQSAEMLYNVFALELWFRQFEGEQ